MEQDKILADNIFFQRYVLRTDGGMLSALAKKDLKWIYRSN